MMDDIKVTKGDAFPLGVTEQGSNQVQVTVWRPKATSCSLCLYKKGRPIKKVKMFPMKEIGIKDIFSVRLTGESLFSMLSEMEYDFTADGIRFQDIYAKAVAGRERFGKKRGKIRARFVFDRFDWEGENWRKLPADEMVLYQCHVRGFTKHTSSGVKAPGTFSGMAEKIPYLKMLGVNTLFLLPVYDFNERIAGAGAKDEKKVNYWGYTKEAFYFAPKAGYSVGEVSPSEEFQGLVKELHKNGMNLILDMYFAGQTPEFILQCLRYYVLHFHVDGFRMNQDCMDTAWLREDPVLSHVKLFGNSWGDCQEDAGEEKLFEINDGFMVDARRYLKSDEGQTEKFYHRYREQRNGVGLIHYITQHNGFTLRDLISYDVKHNEPNGEKNQDGTEYNYSWNCGVEGATRRKPILRMRARQERNAFVMLLLGMATPMLLAGDEFGNSQKGNNNAYCQDNTTTWLDWRLLEKNRETFEFVKELLKFRNKNPIYHQKKRLTGLDTQGVGVPDVSCHGREPWVVDFSYYSRELGILYYGGHYGTESLYFAFNFHWDSHEFYLPDVETATEWKILFDTAGTEQGKIVSQKYWMEPRSITVFESICKGGTDSKTASNRRRRAKAKKMPSKKN